MLRETPYKGLVPYDEEDADFFFGRDSLRDIIVANLMASRLTLLYGPSGVGKSSVLRAGVEHHLRNLTEREIQQRGKTDFACVVFNLWRDNPIDALEQIIEKSVSRLTDPKAANGQRRNELFVDFLGESAKSLDGDIYVVLDQFEEYFLYHPNEDEEKSFAVQFPEAVNRANLRVNFLISIREDALAKLDFFKGRINRLFDNYLRIDHLDRDAAKEAIEKPVRKYNQRYRPNQPPITIEPVLTEAVLDQVKAGKLSLGETGGGFIEVKKMAERVETPYLQLVMTRLWNEELAAGSTTLNLATLQRLGNAEKIVRTHLDETMFSLSQEEQETAASAFHYLVTPSGTKIAYYASDLAKNTGESLSQIEPVLEKLSTGGSLILRKVAVATAPQAPPRYEIFHDVLAQAVLDWRSRFNLNRQFMRQAMSEEQKKVFWYRFKLVAGILALVGIAVLAIYAYSKAQEVKRLKSLVFVKQANRNLGSLNGVLFAQRALKESSTEEAETTLRRALREFPGLQTFYHAGGILAADLSPDGRYVVTGGKDGSVILWNAKTGEVVNRFEVPGWGFTVSFSNTSNLILTIIKYDDSYFHKRYDVALWDPFVGQKKQTIPVKNLTNAWLSSDDRYVLITRYDHQHHTSNDQLTIQVWEINSGVSKDVQVLSQSHKFGVVVRFSRAGDSFLIQRGNVVEVWKGVSSPSPVMKLEHPYYVTMATFSPNGNLVATSTSGEVRLTDLTTGKVQSLSGDIYDFARMVAFSEDGALLAASGETEVIVWDIGSGNTIGIFNKHVAAINVLAFSSDGSRLLTASDDLKAKVSYIRNQGEMTFPAHQYGVQIAEFSRDGEFVLTASGDKARLWRARKLNGQAAWEDSASIADLLATIEQRVGGRVNDDELDSYLPQ